MVDVTAVDFVVVTAIDFVVVTEGDEEEAAGEKETIEEVGTIAVPGVEDKVEAAAGALADTDVREDDAMVPLADADDKPTTPGWPK